MFLFLIRSILKELCILTLPLIWLDDLSNHLYLKRNGQESEFICREWIRILKFINNLIQSLEMEWKASERKNYSSTYYSVSYLFAKKGC
ncbi:hypothetical protein LINPERHAP1_LOCUS27294 [Linum perenne]